MRFRSRSVVALAILVGATTACSVGGPGPTSTVAPDVKTAIIALGQQPPELWSAHDVVRRDCMRKEGFDLPFDSVGSGKPNAALIGLSGLFASEDSARASGYATTMRDAPADPDAGAELQIAERDRARYDRAMFGDEQDQELLQSVDGAVVSRSKHGCVAQADTAVFGSVRNTLLVTDFANSINAQASKVMDGAESVLTKNLDTYRTCMASQDITIRSLDADEVAERRFGVYRDPGEPPSADEQNMAVTDYRCQQQADLVSALNNEFLSKSGDWATVNETSIMANYEILSASLGRAKAILAAT